MIIVGINSSNHDGSVCLIKDGEVIFNIQEERFNDIKHSPNVYLSLAKIKDYVDHIDVLAISGISINYNPYSDIIKNLGKSFLNHEFKLYDFSNNHHMIHAATAFYNSGFQEALCIVKDGRGSQTGVFNNQPTYEMSTTYEASYPNNFKKVDQVSFYYKQEESDFPSMKFVDGDHTITNSDSEAGAYDVFSKYLSLPLLEGAGKIMGMSAYGKENPNISLFTIDGMVNNKTFRAIADPDSLNFGGKISNDFTYTADIAYRLQKDIQDNVLKYILDMLKKTGQKSLCLSGGYFMNCVANYYFLDKIPKDIKIYIEPMSTDNGNALGVAKYASFLHSASLIPVPQKSIYYGIKYNYSISDLILEKTRAASKADVANLLADKKIVAIYQGCSEAGYRALGNRSILYDPRDPDGKDHVNTVKKREWYRPFAGTVLFEKSKEWFNLKQLEESPYMMYAVDVLQNKKEIIPAITHVDGTCRVQTLKKDQNKNFYDLIQEFEKITGIPILFNTSFNLAGHTMVETLKDALWTLHNSDIDYLYLPELEVLVW